MQRLGGAARPRSIFTTREKVREREERERQRETEREREREREQYLVGRGLTGAQLVAGVHHDRACTGAPIEAENTGASDRREATGAGNTHTH
eukprot:COSAG03_NODE_17574_length_372_cov_1.336996_1_plen_91_part_10